MYKKIYFNWNRRLNDCNVKIYNNIGHTVAGELIWQKSTIGRLSRHDNVFLLSKHDCISWVKEISLCSLSTVTERQRLLQSKVLKVGQFSLHGQLEAEMFRINPFVFLFLNCCFVQCTRRKWLLEKRNASTQINLSWKITDFFCLFEQHTKTLVFDNSALNPTSKHKLSEAKSRV